MGHTLTLPSGWKTVQLNEIAMPIKDKAGDKVLETLSISAGIGFVNQANKFGRELSGKQYIHYTVLKQGEFSFNKGNSRKYPYGCIYMLRDRTVAAVPNAFYSFRINNQCGDYFEQLFMFGCLNKQLKRLINTGVRDDGLFNLYEEDFYNCRITLPPLPEQKRIAEILIEQDKLISLKERLITAKKKQKKWLMQNLLTGKIRLEGFSGEWENKVLSDMVVKCVCKNLDFKVSKVLTNSAQNGIVLQLEHFNKDIAVGSNIGSYYLVGNGDFVYNPRISVTAPCGPICRSHLVEDGVISPLYLVFRLDNNTLINGEYLEQFFMSSIWFRYIKGVANYGARHDRINITDDVFFAMPVIIPKIEEQTAIAERLTAADQEIELLIKELEAQKQVKKYLMQQLFTGKIRVTGGES